MTAPLALTMKRQVFTKHKYIICNKGVVSLLFTFFFTSQKNKGRKKLQNSEMDKDARRRKADEMRE